MEEELSKFSLVFREELRNVIRSELDEVKTQLVLHEKYLRRIDEHLKGISGVLDQPAHTRSASGEPTPGVDCAHTRSASGEPTPGVYCREQTTEMGESKQCDKTDNTQDGEDAVHDKFITKTLNEENMYANASKSKKRRIRKMRLIAKIKAQEEEKMDEDDANEIEPGREIRETEKERVEKEEKVKVYEEAQKAADDSSEIEPEHGIRKTEREKEEKEEKVKVYEEARKAADDSSEIETEQEIRKTEKERVEKEENAHVYIETKKAADDVSEIETEREIRDMEKERVEKEEKVKVYEEAKKTADDASEREPEREIRETEKERVEKDEKVKIYEEAQKAADDASEKKSEREIRDMEKERLEKEEIMKVYEEAQKAADDASEMESELEIRDMEKERVETEKIASTKLTQHVGYNKISAVPTSVYQKAYKSKEKIVSLIRFRTTTESRAVPESRGIENNSPDIKPSTEIQHLGSSSKDSIKKVAIKQENSSPNELTSSPSWWQGSWSEGLLHGGILIMVSLLLFFEEYYDQIMDYFWK